MSNNEYNEFNNEYNNFMEKPVEINTMFSSAPIIGQIIETTPNSITVAPTLSNSGTDYHKSNVDKDNTYYLPHSSILSMKEL